MSFPTHFGINPSQVVFRTPRELAGSWNKKKIKVLKKSNKSDEGISDKKIRDRITKEKIVE